MKVLIIDDMEDIRKMVTRRLKRAGFEIECAENGQIGVEMAMEIQPDVILMDMHMPVMNGYESTMALREKGYTGLIVALTASAMVTDTKKSLNAGCDHYLSKPIGADFEEKLRAIIKEKGALA